MRKKILPYNEDDDDFEEDDTLLQPQTRKTNMRQSKTTPAEPQVLYLGRLVNKTHFRAFVYGDAGEKLVESYEDYLKSTSTGLWFSTQAEYESAKKSLAKKSKKAQAEPEDQNTTGTVNDEHTDG